MSLPHWWHKQNTAGGQRSWHWTGGLEVPPATHRGERVQWLYSSLKIKRRLTFHWQMHTFVQEEKSRKKLHKQTKDKQSVCMSHFNPQRWSGEERCPGWSTTDPFFTTLIFSHSNISHIKTRVIKYHTASTAYILCQILNINPLQPLCKTHCWAYLHEVRVFSQDGPCNMLVVLQQLIRQRLNCRGNCDKTTVRLRCCDKLLSRRCLGGGGVAGTD